VRCQPPRGLNRPGHLPGAARLLEFSRLLPGAHRLLEFAGLLPSSVRCPVRPLDFKRALREGGNGAEGKRNHCEGETHDDLRIVAPWFWSVAGSSTVVHAAIPVRFRNG
jgi:hypothetical protein